jgi:hypothetical protein
MRWEYELSKPRIDVRRFFSVGTVEEYETLLRDPTVTDVWWFPPTGDLDATSPEAFTLLQHTINGVTQTNITRHTRQGGQIYLVKPNTAIAAEPVWHVNYLHQVLVEQHGYQLSLDFDKPTQGLHVDFNYDDRCGIEYVNVDTKIIGSQKPRITRDPPTASTSTITIASDGWAYPHSGITLGWTLHHKPNPT